MRRRHGVWFVAIFFVASAARGEAPDPAVLLPALAKGGHVIFLRHPATHPDQADTNPLHLEDVAAQRQLTDEGRAQARALGAAWRALGIPVERVVSSQFQRAAEAARLLDVGPVTTSLDVSEGGLVVSPNENKRRAAALRALLGSPPAAGKNLVIVSHRPNLQDAAGKELADAVEGEVIVFAPRGDASFAVVARVPAPATWTEWAAAR